MRNVITMRSRAGERGATLVFFAFFILFLMCATALAIHHGMLYVARSEAERSADAAALAGANVFTGNCSADSTCETPSVQTAAALRAIAAAQANFVAGAPGDINCDLSSGLYASTTCPGIQFTDPTSSGTEPQITVTAQRTGIPLIFARMFNVRVGNVSAVATAEAYGPGIQQCPTPFLIPNCDPNQGNATTGTDSNCSPAMAPFVKVISAGSNYVSVPANPGPYDPNQKTPGVYGEPWTLHYAYPNIQTGPSGGVVASQWSMAAYGNNGASTMAEYIASCPSFAVGCGSTVQTKQGNTPVVIDSAVNNLIEHASYTGQGQGDGMGNGQDYLNPIKYDINNNLYPYTYDPCGDPIFPFVVGSWSKAVGNIGCSQFGNSASIIKAPVYEGNTLNPGMNQVTVVGFVVLFLDSSQVAPVPGVGMEETIQADVLNVIGCGNSTGTAGASPIPIRLIQSP